MSRLKEKYIKETRKKLTDKFGYKNSMLVPKMVKVILNMGMGDLARDKGVIEDCVRDLTVISGQKPIITKAKKSISNFKLREGVPIGLKVTLRGNRMNDFIDRFCNIVSPRILDFRGFNKKLDGKGNYSVGLKDHQVFPELDLDAVKRTVGMDITFVTSAQTDEEGESLLRELGIPFKK
ncbi:50S ribosomal protein L5 [Chlamydiales bacterium SCGC AB-751-O23]|jgi:large subunit ribosomal protein L5|nr:50S ribosomal protein L5 [Chlamydiales bacterium SCGC AB-751-O23]